MKSSLALVLATAGIVGSAQAQGLLAVSPEAQGDVDGSLPVTFSTYLGAGYDSNAGNSSGGDSATYLQGSLGAEWARVTRRTEVGLGINGGLIAYLDSPEGLEEDVLYNARVDFRFSYKISDQATIRNYAYLAYEVEPDYAIGESGLRRNGQYFYGYDQLNLDYTWNRRFSTRTFATITGIAYDDSALSAQEDRMSYELGNDFRYVINDRSTGVLGYAAEFTNYDSGENDALTQRAYAGLDHQHSRRLSSSLRLGVQHRDADLTGESTAPYASLGVTGQMTRRLSLSWLNRYGFDNSEASYSNNLAFRSALSANYQATEDLSFYGSLTYVHSSKSDVTVDGVDDFSDDAVSASIGANYALNRWVSLTAGYTYYNVSSDISDRDYNRHVISAGVAAKWD